jgi:hypothetical protein
MSGRRVRHEHESPCEERVPRARRGIRTGRRDRVCRSTGDSAISAFRAARPCRRKHAIGNGARCRFGSAQSAPGEAGVRRAAAQGPEALRRYIWRTRMIYNYYYWDFATR